MEKKKRVAVFVCAVILIIAGAGLSENRTIDGSNNNLANPNWGAVGTQLIRQAQAAYWDGISVPAGRYRPSPRLISNVVMKQDEPIFNEFGVSDYLWAWGQFIDHEISVTTAGAPAEPFDIVIPPGDQKFDPDKKGGVNMPLSRSVYDLATGYDSDNPRQQLNMVTAWIDGSTVYGSDEARASWLRTGNKGRLKVTPHPLYGDLLPYNDGTQPNAGGPGTDLFVAGDTRVNQNPPLIAMQILFLREHNRLAGLIAAAYPDWSDEQIYQFARKIVAAQIQVVTYNEFLPALLRKYNLPPYAGYKPHVNPTVSTEFSTAAYRFGHTTVSPVILRLDEDMKPSPFGNIVFDEAFVRPTVISEEGGVEPILRGLAYQLHQKIDVYVIDGLRDNLFAILDLASLNIQRGRDHGLPDYNSMRAAYGLKVYASFAELTKDVRVQSALECVYGDIDDMDAWVGILAEDNGDGEMMGNLLRTVVRDQFERLRDGDRFWYQNDPALKELVGWLNSLRLSDIIMYNTNIRDLPKNVFMVPTAPTADEMHISAAYLFKGLAPGCDSAILHGYSMDATQEDMANCKAVKVAIYLDGSTIPVMSEAVPVSAGLYSRGVFIYRGRESSGITYLQLDLVHKTFCMIARRLDLGSLKNKMTVEIRIDGYHGRGETTQYVWK